MLFETQNFNNNKKFLSLSLASMHPVIYCVSFGSIGSIMQRVIPISIYSKSHPTHVHGICGVYGYTVPPILWKWVYNWWKDEVGFSIVHTHTHSAIIPHLFGGGLVMHSVCTLCIVACIWFEMITSKQSWMKFSGSFISRSSIYFVFFCCSLHAMTVCIGNIFIWVTKAEVRNEKFQYYTNGLVCFSSIYY